jgi:hypothetical protein
VARLDGPLADAARHFVLLRLTRMRGADLDLFDFDYDLTWAGFFLDAGGRVYGRYGGRDADSPDSKLSLAGLCYAMDSALAAHRRAGPAARAEPPPPRRTVDQYPAARRLPETACVHCHQVYEFRRHDLQARGAWRLDELWVYPPPENVGLTLEVDRGDFVARVADGSPGARAGLLPGDRLVTVDGRPVASFADAQYALHKAGPAARLPVVWRRGGREMSAELDLPDGWRKTDVSWRWSLRTLDPSPCVHGDDLPAEEKRALGLGERRLAFRHGPFVPAPAERAGIRQNDVIVGVDGKALEMTERQFAAYVRLNYKSGDRVVYNVLRGGRCLDVPLTLPGRAP